MFGRDREIRRLVEMIDGAHDASRAVVIDGPPGIGKSTLLQVAIAHAVERGYTVATARPTLAEATLGFAVLADLLRHADLSVLPDAPRHVPETALGQRAATHNPVGQPGPRHCWPERPSRSPIRSPKRRSMAKAAFTRTRCSPTRQAGLSRPVGLRPVDAATSELVLDPVTSPAIDAGDPSADFSAEPDPNGGRIDMGHTGNTPAASRSA